MLEKDTNATGRAVVVVMSRISHSVKMNTMHFLKPPQLIDVRAVSIEQTPKSRGHMQMITGQAWTCHEQGDAVQAEAKNNT